MRSGVNQNLKWSIVTSGRGYGSGRFGRDRIEVLSAVARLGDCFWDIGAHHGFLTFAGSTLVGPGGTVVSIGPSKWNRWFLHRHLRWNPRPNVTVVPAAVAGASGEARFGGSGATVAYRLGAGDETVPVLTIPDVMTRFGVPAPSLLKIDVEGAESDVLRGSGGSLRSDVALLISVHGPARREECLAWLLERDFRIFESRDMALCSADRNRPWTDDYDLLAIGADRRVDVESLEALSLFRGE